jgi:hypothetical protein
VTTGNRPASRRNWLVSSATALLGLGLAASSADAAILVDFKPDPISPNLYELSLIGPNLEEASGALGNGDGAADPATQTPGGLIIQTPVNIPTILGLPVAIFGGAVGPAGTVFYDTSLTFEDLNATGPATRTEIIPGALYVLSQNHLTGRFTLTTTDPAGPDVPQVLLTGTIASATLSGVEGGNAGDVQSNTITYDGGLIYNALLAAGGTATGSMALSLADTSAPFQQSPIEGLQGFNAHMTGAFSTPAVPEPATMSVLGIATVGLLARRRRLA